MNKTQKIEKYFYEKNKIAKNEGEYITIDFILNEYKYNQNHIQKTKIVELIDKWEYFTLDAKNSIEDQSEDVLDLVIEIINYDDTDYYDGSSDDFAECIDCNDEVRYS